MLITAAGPAGEPTLYLGGRFVPTAALPVPWLQRLSGPGPWVDVEPGGLQTNTQFGSVRALADLAPFGADGLFAGGEFTIAGAAVSHSIAEFRIQPDIFADGFEGGDTSAWDLLVP